MINSCTGYIYWIDKYFSTGSLELLAKSFDKNKVREIRILISKEKAEENLRSLFKKFKEETKNHLAVCEMRVITDSELKGKIHDRWILSENSCFNTPSYDTIARGQWSEIKKTENRPPFTEWWHRCLDIINQWNDINKR